MNRVMFNCIREGCGIQKKTKKTEKAPGQSPEKHRKKQEQDQKVVDGDSLSSVGQVLGEPLQSSVVYTESILKTTK